jgi:hypothetical protein
MSALQLWQQRHGISADAMHDLLGLVGVRPALKVQPDKGTSEAAVTARVRLASVAMGMQLWRNNSGVLQDVSGRPVRFGLMNESPEMNAKFKSADLVGGTPVVITPRHVGRTLEVLTMLELKEQGWKFSPRDKREVAQRAALEYHAARGAICSFISDESQLEGLVP